MRHRYEHGLDLDRGYLATGGNGGYQAINLAVHFGARRIFLLGFDCQPTGGATHFHGDHRGGLTNPRDETFRIWQRAFPTLVEPLGALGVEIVNCSRATALTCFNRADLGAVLGD